MRGKNIFSILKEHGAPYLLSKVFPGLMGIIAVPVFARLYGFDQYGQIMLIVALGNLITVFSGGWLSQAWLRFQIPWQKRRQLLSATLYSILIAITILFVIFIIINFQKNSPWIPTITQLSAIIFMTIGMLLYYEIHAGLQSALQSKYVLIIASLLSFLSLTLPVLIYHYFDHINGFIISYGAAYFIAAIMGIILFPKSDISSYHSSSNLLNWINYGIPLSLWLSLQAAIPFIDRTIIQIYLGDDLVGKYSALSELVIRGFSLIIFPITMAIYPVMIRQWNQGNQKGAIALWRQILKLLSVIVLFISIIYYLFNNYLVFAFNKLLGDSYQYSSNFFLLVLLSGLFWQSNLLFHKPLELAKKTKTMVISLAFSLLTMVSISINTISEYGIIGVAAASLISAVVYGLLTLGSCIRIIKNYI